jgi:hypothetical protein
MHRSNDVDRDQVGRHYSCSILWAGTVLQDLLVVRVDHLVVGSSAAKV